MPPRAAPFEVLGISLAAVSLSGGLTFSLPVQTSAAGLETSVTDGVSFQQPTLPLVGPTTNVPVTAWSGPPPQIGDQVNFQPPYAVLEPVAPGGYFHIGHVFIEA